jgi:NitT/TauT family transport system permease protein
MNRHLETALRIGLPLATLALFFGLWSYYVRDATISPFILPAPEKIGRSFLVQIADPGVWRHVRVTLTEALGGFFSALVAGVTLGALMAKLPPVEWAFKPFIIALQLIPKVALAPLFILWFGFGLESKIVISGVLAFFPIFANTLVAIKSTDAGDREVFASMRATPLQSFALLELPTALPMILTGAEVAIVLAIIGASVGVFIGGNSGLGYLAVLRLQELQVDALFGVILILALIGLLLYGSVAVLRRVLVPWHQSAATRL